MSYQHEAAGLARERGAGAIGAADIATGAVGTAELEDGSIVAIDIANDAITYAKMQNVSATDKVLGRSTSGAGDPEEIACTAAGRALLDDANAGAQRTTLGLGTAAIEAVAAFAAAVHTHTLADVTDVTATAAELNSGRGAGVKRYVALLTQTGTSAPTAVVLENSLGGEPTFGYADVGDYTMTLTGAFPANRTPPYSLLMNVAEGQGLTARRVSDNVINIISGTIGTGAADVLLAGDKIEIVVYPAP